MEKNWNTLRQEIRKRKDMEHNLPLYLNRMTSMYTGFASYNLAMDYPVLAELCADGTVALKADAKSCLKTYKTLLNSLLLEEFESKKWEKDVAALVKLRDTIIHRMDALTAYTDLFSVYQFVLKRIEPEILGKVEAIDEEQEISTILAMLFQDNDATMIKERLRIIISELPVRMTKGKFFEYIENAFGLYQEADVESIDLFMYMLRSAAGLYRPQEMGKLVVLKNYMEKLENTDFTQLTAKDYKALTTGMDKVIKEIAASSDYYCQLQDCINALLVCALLRPYEDGETKQSLKNCKEVLRLSLQEDFSDETLEHMDVLFADFEGKQEELLVTLEREAETMDSLKEEQTLLQATMTDKQYEAMSVVQRLQTVSRFAELTVEDKHIEDTVAYLKAEKLAFLETLDETFKESPRMLNRARMAMILKELPLFRTQQEILDYIRASISLCKDGGERMVSVREIKEQLADM